MREKRFFVETFGCQMNTADSLEMSRRLVRRGFRPTRLMEKADVVLVNTCTVRDHAEHKALSFLGRLVDWKEEKSGRLIFFAGCAAERLKETLTKRFPQVDWVVGAKSLPAFDRLLDDQIKNNLGFPRVEPTIDWSSEDAPTRNDFSEDWGWFGNNFPSLEDEGPSGFVTVTRGCNFSCAYCIVPAVRGKEIYRPPESVLLEVTDRAERGQREIIFLGQTVNGWNWGGPGPVKRFSDLLRAAADVPGIKRLRFMSPHPFHLSDDLIAVFGDTPSVCPHVHLPVQSGADSVLSRMRRGYTKKIYLKRLDQLRRARPGLSVTTDWIVGYPGETEQEFEETLILAREADFDGAYCFKYSPRAGTASAAVMDDVPEPVKEERHQRLLTLNEEIGRRKTVALVGTCQDVMVESPRGGDGVYNTRTAHNRIMHVLSKTPRNAGDFLSVSVSDVKGKTLHGTAL